MAKKKSRKQAAETDGAYILKLVMYLIIGVFWIKITYGENEQLPLPAGFVIGVLYAMHDHFKIDRKIEYALLLIAMLIGFWLPIGLFIAL